MKRKIIQDDEEEEERGNSESIKEPQLLIDEKSIEIAKSELIPSSKENLAEEKKIENEESKEFFGIPEVEETKGSPLRQKVSHDLQEDSDDSDSFIHCDPNIRLSVGEEDEANLTG